MAERSLAQALEQSGTLAPMSRKNWGYGSVYLRGRTWWISYPFNGQQIKESSHYTDKAKANKLLKDRIKKIMQHDFGGIAAERVLVDELLDDLLENYRINRKSYDWAELLVRCHLRPFFGYYRASAVGTTLIQRYVSERRKAGRSNATINNELALLRRAFNLGSRCEPPKVARVPRIAGLEVSNTRRGFFTVDDFEKLRAELPDEIKPVAVFAYYTGCRRGEILSLAWDQFDRKARMVRLEPGTTKNDEGRSVPLVDELFDVLAVLKAERDENWPRCPWMFSRAGTPIKSFRGSWDAACKAAGLVDGEGEPNSIFHDLRRTGVRNLVRAGVPEAVAMRISGHKTRSVFDRYNIVDERDLREAATKLQKFIKEPK